LQLFSLRAFLHLIRIKVTLAVTFSAFIPSVVFLHGFSPVQILPVLAIFLLAAGASALNQYQERDYDAKMNRTKGRPLPSNEMKPPVALILSLILILSGFVLMSIAQLWITLLLGVFNLLWYNGLYTWLKRKTVFAVVPGALTGAIPVFMGWTACGGSLLDPFPLFVAFFIFMWQVPHFWLLEMIFEKDYKSAGFPVIADVFRLLQLKKIIFTWLFAASLSSLFLIHFGIITDIPTRIIALLLNFLLLILSAFHLFFTEQARFRLLFIMVNVFMLLILLLAVIDSISFTR
jgi:heme o synthase